MGAATRDVPRADDRAMALAIAAEVLRWSASLDALIDGATRQRLPDDAKARMVLKIALAQALAMRTAPHAAIATALPLVDGGPRRLVHGVFGSLMRNGAALPDRPALPADVALRWRVAWGDAMLDEAAHAIAAPPPLDLSLKRHDETDHWCRTLGGISLAPGHVRVARGGAVHALPGYGEGAWWVQDLAAGLPARLLGAGRGTCEGVGEGRHVLDLCAAPGGKTMQLAAAGWRVTALDSAPRRMALLQENLARTGLNAAVDTIVADALGWSPPQAYDAVLIDAPCSATGIFRRHPDVLHRVTRDMIATQAALQARLLDRAAQWVKPGGLLVYASCSLEPEEGEAQLTAFLGRQPGFAAAPHDATQGAHDALPAGIDLDSMGALRILPGRIADGGADGFFMARLVRLR